MNRKYALPLTFVERAILLTLVEHGVVRCYNVYSTMSQKSCLAYGRGSADYVTTAMVLLKKLGYEVGVDFIIGNDTPNRRWTGRFLTVVENSNAYLFLKEIRDMKDPWPVVYAILRLRRR